MSQLTGPPPPAPAVPSGPPAASTPPPPAWAHVHPTNTKAILAVALIGVAPAAIVFGLLARSEIRRTGEGGWGLATWGVGLGTAALVLSTAYVAVVYLLVFGMAVFTMDHPAVTPAALLVP